MGNNPSTAAKPNTTPPGSSTPGSLSHSTSRREPKLRDNIQAQRIAAPPEPSLAQARGTNVTHRPRSTPHTSLDSHTPSPKDQIGSFQSKSSDSPKPEFKDEPSKPVAVPISSNTISSEVATLRSPYADSQIEASAPMNDISYHITRPPRLPLPIEEEVHTPGSPILAPTSSGAPVPEIQTLEDTDAQPSRVASALSTTTAEDDEDTDELPIDKTRPVVPVEFVWNGHAEKCYVTGTIFQWSRKSKLYPVPGKPDQFSAIIHVRPGTHHIRFLVDGNMTVSKDMPTTVDFGNNLVNYIEVSADDVPREPPSAKDDRITSVDGREQRPVASTRGQESKDLEEEQPPKPVRTKPVLPSTYYSSAIPQYLVDLDKPEDTTAYQYAAAAIEKLPSPPSLPGFLGKPILNAATPMKDDNSVLNMPNHTVLNHLATSSIKNNVLAVSATTRYKSKYVTTIMYKPTSDDTS